MISNVLFYLDFLLTKEDGPAMNDRCCPWFHGEGVQYGYEKKSPTEESKGDPFHVAWCLSSDVKDLIRFMALLNLGKPYLNSNSWWSSQLTSLWAPSFLLGFNLQETGDDHTANRRLFLELNKTRAARYQLGNFTSGKGYQVYTGLERDPTLFVELPSIGAQANSAELFSPPAKANLGQIRDFLTWQMVEHDGRDYVFWRSDIPLLRGIDFQHWVEDHLTHIKALIEKQGIDTVN